MEIIYFILGFGVASLIIYRLMRWVTEESVRGRGQDLTEFCQSFGEPTPINPEQIKKHKYNLGQIVGYMGMAGRITNQETRI